MRLDRQRMDVGRKQIAERVVDQAVAPQQRQPRELLGHNAQPEMTTAVSRAGMTGMPVAFIHHFQRPDVQRRFQATADFALPPRCLPGRTGHQGSTGMNGVTSTSRYTPAVT